MSETHYQSEDWTETRHRFPPQNGFDLLGERFHPDTFLLYFDLLSYFLILFDL